MNAPMAPKPGAKSPQSTGRLQNALNKLPKSSVGSGASFREILEGAAGRNGGLIPRKTQNSRPPETGRDTSPKNVGQTARQQGLSPSIELDRRNKSVPPETQGPQGGLLAQPFPRDVPQLRPGDAKRRETGNTPAAPGVRSSAAGINIVLADTPREVNHHRQMVESDTSGKSRVKLTVVDRRRSAMVRESATAFEGKEAVQGANTDAIKKDGAIPQPKENTATVWARVESPATLSRSSAGTQPVRQIAVPQQFYQQLHGEFLDRAKLILKDGGGEMRLTIRPQNLGSLRLSVTLEERVLKGQIVVDNETVKTIVESQLDSLLRSFREGGFDPLELSVSVAGEDGGRESRREGNFSSRQKEEDFQQAQRSQHFERQNHIALEA